MVKSKAAEIINTPDSGYASISLPQDTKQLRDLFDKMPKNPDHFYHHFMEKLHQQHVPSQLEISVMLKSTQSDPEFFQFIKKH